MSAQTTALLTAKWFVAWAQGEDADLSNLKLQKLLYYAQGYHLALRGRPLFDDEIQAWSHGPVVPSVWRLFKDFGSSDVFLPTEDSFAWADVDPATTDLLMSVWDRLGDKAAWKLRDMTHSEAPWREAFRQGERFTVISRASIERYFRSFAGVQGVA